MPEPRRRRLFLYVAALAAAAALLALVVIAHLSRPRPGNRPADVRALLERVRPLGLHAVAVNINGNPSNGVYLCTAAREWVRCAALVQDARRVRDWSGVVLITPCSPRTGGEGERVGPFLLFGDPDLVRAVRGAMAE